MDYNNTAEVKENLIKSKDILNLLANLYCYCSKKFRDIDNLYESEKRGKFYEYSLRYKVELSEIGLDVFSADFQQIKDALRRIDISDPEEFGVNIWALLRAFDEMLSDDTIYLKLIRSRDIQSSRYFGHKRFLLLSRPKNFIFEAINKRFPDDRIKTGPDIGQRLEDHLKNLIFYKEHENRKIEIRPIDLLVDQLLLKQGEKLAIAVAPITCNFRYSFKGFRHGNEVSYVFESIKNRDQITRYIERILEKCRDNDVHIVVFPELTIDEDLRWLISKWLKKNNKDKKIIMVVAGSFHILKDKQKDRKFDKYENSSIVYRFDGVELWKQVKMNRFQMDQGDIKRTRDSDKKGYVEFKKLFKDTDSKAREKIDISDTLIIKDSAIGRMAVTICLDHFVKEKDELLSNPQVNLIFVPAMSRTLDKMKEASSYLGNHAQASVFCANSCWTITGGQRESFDPKNSSYIYIPQKGDAKHINHKPKLDCSHCEPQIFRIRDYEKNG